MGFIFVRKFKSHPYSKDFFNIVRSLLCRRKDSVERVSAPGASGKTQFKMSQKNHYFSTHAGRQNQHLMIFMTRKI
jgi:hypothetical protein